MKRLLWLAAGIAWLTFAAQPALFGQWKKKEDVTTRSVQGTVSDADGKQVEGAVVHLKDAKTLQIRSFITRPDGSYTFQGLSTTVDYELKAEWQRMTSDTKTLSVFDSRRRAVINLKLNKKP